MPRTASSAALRSRTSRDVAYRLAAVAALYAAYLGVSFVVGPAAFAPGGWYWLDAAVIAATAALMLHRGWPGSAPLQRVLLGNAACLVALLVSDLSSGRDLPLWRGVGGPALQLTDVAWAVFLFGWICVWGMLLLGLVRRQRPGPRTVGVFVLLMAGLVGLFAGFYWPLYRGSLSQLDGRLDIATAALELLAVVTGSAVIMLGASRALVLQVFGLTLLVASDLFYSEAAAHREVIVGADPVWLLGLCTGLTGALALPRGRDGLAFAAAGAARRSGLSTLLLALSLGAVLVSALVSLTLRGAEHGAGAAAKEPFFFVLFVVALVVVMVWLTERFDRAVDYAVQHAAGLLGQRLRAPDWRGGDRRLAWVLDATGLGALLDALHTAAGKLRQDVLFLGPERLNPPPQDVDRGTAPTCFLVMPFGQPDSDRVHAVLRQACEQAGLRPLRGDDLFTPTDILDDIWRGITAAHCVIADISGRNPNVLYELGIAHTLAKPVLIVSRSADDIPIDLATRRVIVYGGASGSDWAATLADRARAALQALLRDYPPG
jgi:hypothetical protein